MGLRAPEVDHPLLREVTYVPRRCQDTIFPSWAEGILRKLVAFLATLQSKV